MLPYTVKVKYTKGPEQTIALFKDRNDALNYIQTKLQKDKELRVETIYQLWELGDLEKSFDQTNAVSSPSSSNTESTGGKTSSQSFRPSPVQTTLRPPGMPSNWRDDSKDENNK